MDHDLVWARCGPLTVFLSQGNDALRLLELDNALEPRARAGAVFNARVSAIDAANNQAFIDLGADGEGVLGFRRAKPLARRTPPRHIGDCVREGEWVKVRVRRATVADDAKRVQLDTRVDDVEGSFEADTQANESRIRCLHPAPDCLARAFRLLPPGRYRLLADPLIDRATLGALLAERGDVELEVQLPPAGRSAWQEANISTILSELLQARVDLPKGGWISIHPTPALTAIDVNAGSQQGRHAPRTHRQVNEQAARAAADYLRLANIGGLVVIDFIDMPDKADREAVQKTFDRAIADDSKPVQRGRISGFGLMEVARTSDGPSLLARLGEAVKPRTAPALQVAHLLDALRAHGVGLQGPGHLLVRVPPVLHAVLDAHPAWLEELSVDLARPIRLEPLPASTSADQIDITLVD